MKIDPSKNIPTGSSEAQDWISWHKDLKKIFGKKKANSIWTYAWSKRGGVNSAANTRTLSNYMEKQGVDIQRTALSELGEGILDFGSGIWTAGKWIGLIALGVVGIILVRILWKLSADPNQTLGQVVAIKGGRRY